MHPRVISLDIESSGILRNGKQSTFHPMKVLHLDGGTLADLCVSICITLPTEDPRTWPTPPVIAERWKIATSPRYSSLPSVSSPSSPTASSKSSNQGGPSPSPWNLWQLAGLSPATTMHLDPRSPRDISILAQWLSHCDTLVGMNLKFDILFLRAFSPLLRRLLCGRHTIIDLSVANFLHSENRPERSLKAMGPVLGTHAYTDEVLSTYGDDKTKKYDSPDDPALIDHNAQDTHNTLLAIRELARRIIRDYGITPKLSPFCTAFFSETTWTCLFMEESGLCFSLRRLKELETRLLARSLKIAAIVAPLVTVTRGVKGLKKTQLAFMNAALDAATTASGVDLRSHPSLQLTEKKREISFSESNFNLLRLHLPHSHPYARACRLLVKQKYAEKLVSTYTYPLLRGTRPNDEGTTKIKRDQVCIPLPANPFLGVTYPSWFITPGSIKDDAASSGGTKQGRITCKGPAVQTFPPPIKHCQHTRFPGGLRVGDDLSQIELRVAALLSGEPSMVDEYAKEWKGEKPDLHRQMAVSVFGPDIVNDPHWKDGTWDDPRQWGGKTPNFLILYRGGPDKYQDAVLRDSGRMLPLDLCHRVVTGAKAARPILWAWQDSLIRDARRDGYLSLPLTGHTRTFLTGRGAKWDENEICNFKVQTVAGLIQLAYQHTLTRLLAPFTREGGPIALMEANVYDAVYFDLRSSAYLPLLKELCHEAITHQEKAGYWAALQDHFGRRVPLNHELKALA